MKKDRIILKISAPVFMMALLLIFSGCGKKWATEEKGDYNLVFNRGGQTLGHSPNSGVMLLTDKGYAFKDLNKNGKLDPYEDWRLSVDERAKDLATKMSVEQIAGLMLYSAHQAIPSGSRGPLGGGTYNSKPFAESGAKANGLSDAQKKFLTEDNLRHVLITTVESPAVAAQWNNNMQTVDEQFEDVPRDMECYTDLEGNTYDFAYGLNWDEVINDERVNKYK